MKVLRIIARLNVGGPARHVVWLTKHLKKDAVETLLIAGRVPEGEADMAYFAREEGVEPVFIEDMSRELSLRDLTSLWKIYSQIKRFEPDIVHTHTAKAGTVGRAAAFLYRWFTPHGLIGRPRKICVIHTFHGHVFHSYYGNAKTRLFLAIERLLARFATDRIVVISEQQLGEIHDRFGVGHAKQFSIIPLGLDLAPFVSAREGRYAARYELGISEAEVVVGYSGRLTEIKNLRLLIEAATHTPQLRFLIIGDGALRRELEEAAPGNVTFLGNRSDVAHLISAVDIIALSSKNEGTPLSLIEAMAAGIPFVSTAVGGVVDLAGEVVESRKSIDICVRGVLVRDATAESFAEALEVLAGDDALRWSMAGNGSRYAQEAYSLERLTSDVLALYCSLRRS